MSKRFSNPSIFLLSTSALLVSGEVIAEKQKSVYISGDYYMFGLASGDTVPGRDSEAVAGIARLTMDWLVNQDKADRDTGLLRLKVDHKHSYTDTSPSQFVMTNVGGFGLIQPAFSDIGLRLTNLYWKQQFNDQGTELMAGFLDSTDYINTYSLGNPYSGFSNIQFSTGSGTVPIPDESTLGVTIRHMMSDNYYYYFSFSDAKADSTKPFEGFSNFFNDNQYFKSLELGWVSSAESFYTNNSHLLVWHSDGAKSQASENYGANWSTVYKNENWIPFLRAGIAKGPEALYKSSVVVGTGYLGLGPGMLGFAFGWGKPNASFDDTYNSELYYRLKFGPVSITPNLQYLSDLPFNSKNDQAWVFGLRGRVNISL